MIQQIVLALLVLGLGGSAWARSEFRLGGADGNAWQGLLSDQQAVYVVVDGAGEVSSVLPVTISTATLMTTVG